MRSLGLAAPPQFPAQLTRNLCGQKRPAMHLRWRKRAARSTLEDTRRRFGFMLSDLQFGAGKFFLLLLEGKKPNPGGIGMRRWRLTNPGPRRVIGHITQRRLALGNARRAVIDAIETGHGRTDGNGIASAAGHCKATGNDHKYVSPFSSHAHPARARKRGVDLCPDLYKETAKPPRENHKGL